MPRPSASVRTTGSRTTLSVRGSLTLRRRSVTTMENSVLLSVPAIYAILGSTRLKSITAISPRFFHRPSTPSPSSVNVPCCDEDAAARSMLAGQPFESNDADAVVIVTEAIPPRAMIFIFRSAPSATMPSAKLTDSPGTNPSAESSGAGALRMSSSRGMLTVSSRSTSASNVISRVSEPAPPPFTSTPTW